MIFGNNACKIGVVQAPEDLRQIPMFYRASAAFALLHDKTGTIAKILQQLTYPTKYRLISIDSRTHMLKKGWFPCIPGWHCDDFWRPDGQPDLEHVPSMEHYSVVLGADVATTEFLLWPKELPSPNDFYNVLGSDEPLYKHYNEHIEASDNNTYLAREGDIIKFGPLDFHRGLAAKNSGWRTFIRVTVSNHREPKDEIRTQTQVYLPDLYRGW